MSLFGRVERFLFSHPFSSLNQPSLEQPVGQTRGATRNHRNHIGAELEKWLMLTAQPGTAK